MKNQFADMHCDTITTLYQKRQEQEKESLRKETLFHNSLQLNLDGMQKAGYALQNFAIFLSKEKVKNLYQEALLRISFYIEEMEKNKDIISPVTTYDEIQNNMRAGKMSALLTLEGGEILEGSVDNLHHFYELGVRMLTLTWNFPNELGFPNKGTDIKSGLTNKGIEILQEMERLHIIPDVSHGSDALFYDVCRYTKKPFVASHSNARAVYNHPRNLSDEMIKELAKRGGVMGMNFCADFVSAKSSNDRICYAQDIVRHMRHIYNIGGIECIGLGSDFDGIENAVEWKDASGMEFLYDTMKKAGFTESDCDKILKDNVLRVYREWLA